ncbi:hydrogenase maturation protease [Planctomycetota bacterium]
MPVETNTNLVISSTNGSKKTERILVIGVGNILLKDEGIGVHIAGELQKHDLPDNVEVIDGGTAGLDILLSQDKGYKLVVIDAIKAGEKAGTIYKIRLKEREKDRLRQIFCEKEQAKISLHQVGLLDALTAAEKMNCEPEEVVIFGVEPAEVDCGLELTGQVKSKVDKIIEKVLEEIRK